LFLTVQTPERFDAGRLRAFLLAFLGKTPPAKSPVRPSLSVVLAAILIAPTGARGRRFGLAARHAAKAVSRRELLEVKTAIVCRLVNWEMFRLRHLKKT
jgi:hypothetical protein